MNIVDSETGLVLTECHDDQRIFFYDEEFYLKNVYDYCRFWTRKKSLTKDEFFETLNSLWIQEHIDEVNKEWKHKNVRLK